MGIANALNAKADCTHMLQDWYVAIAQTLIAPAIVHLGAAKVGADQNWSIDIDNLFRRSMEWLRILAVHPVPDLQLLVPVATVEGFKALCQS